MLYKYPFLSRTPILDSWLLTMMHHKAFRAYSISDGCCNRNLESESDGEVVLLLKIDAVKVSFSKLQSFKISYFYPSDSFSITIYCFVMTYMGYFGTLSDIMYMFIISQNLEIRNSKVIVESDLHHVFRLLQNWLSSKIKVSIVHRWFVIKKNIDLIGHRLSCIICVQCESQSHMTGNFYQNQMW